MTEERFDSIEHRTQKVEEAVIKFGYIAETVLVQVEKRLTSLEKHDEEIQSVLYNTCDVKSKEIDDKISINATAIRTQYDKYFIWGVSISSMLFFMMVGYVAYDQGQKADINAALEQRAVAAQESKTHIQAMHNNLARMDDKLDWIFESQAILIDKRVR